MSPLQLSVYWRLSLLFFLTPFVFFLDIFTVAIAARTCRHDNDSDATASWLGTLPPSADSNQSQHGEVSEMNCFCPRLKPNFNIFVFDLFLTHGRRLWTDTWPGFLCRYGKRPVLLVCACVQAFCGLVPAVFPQPLLFLAIRCLTAVCCCCIHICAFSLAWSELQNAAEAKTQTAGSGGHTPSDITQLRHPTILLRLFIMSYLRYSTCFIFRTGGVQEIQQLWCNRS
ncbi:hypothetical protein GOODEAATRI_011060 [Goodea atripinnis]|uniref:Uncharacterized protein n=1 Tax=Goodea atripinnis TaxID=208336 RepID=A0ABV0PML6_9TELE